MKSLQTLLAVVAVGSFGAGEARAQELSLPPVDGDVSEETLVELVTPPPAEQDPCFYFPGAWRARSFLMNTLVGSEVLEMAPTIGTVCSRTYGVHAGSIVGPWAYMFADGQASRSLGPYIPPERVKAARQAAFEAAGGDPTQPVPPVLPRDDRYRLERLAAGHAEVPRIGDGHGTDELATRRVQLRVAPHRGPQTYAGIPIVERGRSWERVQRSDGTRVWVETTPGRTRGASHIDSRRPGRWADSGPASSRASSWNSRMQSLSRSMSSTPSFSRPVDAPRASSRPTLGTSPRAGKKNVEQ